MIDFLNFLVILLVVNNRFSLAQVPGTESGGLNFNIFTTDKPN